ncbi:MAG: cellulose biosynthesis cyclic di-GMP-binding regulatory protein BcsB [Vampirovibrionales bacterium]|nr:cellulose biosynthesis cyclic di-GMP-binding regulatory protein BcsB [Vampirovibrionales bacterium]
MMTRPFSLPVFKKIPAILSLLAFLGGSFLSMWAGITAVQAATRNSLVITMKDMGNPEGHTLKTVRTERRYHFTKPKGWKVQPSSSIHMVFQHSPSLLPERSSLNVLVNERIVKTIRLAKENVVPTGVDIPIPPEILKDHNDLTFQVDQHYTYQCEDPLSAELWTTVLPDTTMKLDYELLPVKPDLAALPYPMVDVLNTYSPAHIGYSVPDGLSPASLEALSTVLVSLGQAAGWRELETSVVPSGSTSTDHHLVLVGTPDENPAISSLSGSFELPLSGGKFSGKDGSALPENYGVIQLVNNPSRPDHVILVVSGNSPEGVKMAAKTLAQNPSNRLLAGKSAVVKEFQPGPQHPYRAWDGFIQESGDNFAKLGLETQTARGYAPVPILYKVKMMPDLFLPGQRKVKVHTFYSYASQLPGQSKLEVKWNGKAIKSIGLDNPKGETNAELTFEINSEEFFTYNELEYQFFLFPDKEDLCRFVTDVHIWGTVHNTSYIELPADKKTAVPDVGLINDAGFPFTAYQDLSETAVVMPKNATEGDKNVFVQTLTRLGRESRSHRGINIRAAYGDNAGDVRGNNHLIVIGNKSRNPLLNELGGKSKLIVENRFDQLKTPDGKQVEVSNDPDQGIIEELISPWNDKRVVLTMQGENDTAMNRIAYLMMNDKWFGSIESGNITVVNADGPKSMTVLAKGEAKFLQPAELSEGFKMPIWGWIVLGFLAILGLISILRFMFGR